MTRKMHFAMHAILCAMCFVVASSSFATEYREGVHYERISPPQPTETGSNVEVLEIFWYGCPHCRDFEPFIEQWLETKPADVEFRRLPGVFHRSWVPHARAYFTAEALGVVDQIHGPLFEAIHRDKRRIFDEASLGEFFVERGVAAEDFSKTYTSFSIDAKVRQATSKAAEYQIRGVPTVIVNGEFRSSGSLAGSYEELLKVIDYLIELERQGTP